MGWAGVDAVEGVARSTFLTRVVLTCDCLHPGPSSDSLCVVSASYVIRATWATGYVVDVSVVVDCLDSGRKNRFGVDGFSIEFEVDRGSTIVKTWNAKLTQDGSVATAHHKRFCAPVYREQALLYFGFEAKIEAGSTFIPTLPKFLKVNGKVCAASACFARDLADCRNDYFESDDDEEDSGMAARAGTSREARRATPEPPRRPRTHDFRQMSAPPVLYRSFGLTSRRFGAEDDESSPATTSVSGFCAESSRGFEWGDDEDHSIAETVRHRNQSAAAFHDRMVEVEGGVEGSGSASTPPMSDAACRTPSDNRQEVANCGVSRKRKFFEEEAADDGMCCQMSSVPPSPSDAEPSSSSSLRYPKTLTLDYYRRSKILKKRKYLHMDYLDTHFRSREKVILDSVLDDSSKPIVIEPNMFPYDTPAGVTHWTLWSRKWLEEEEVEAFVDGWLGENMPQAIEWNHDDNMADGLSINLFHLHVYIRCS